MEVKSAKALRHMLAEYDLTVKEVAKKTGINSSYVSQLMHGRASMTEPFVRRIEAVAKELEANPPPETEAPPARTNRIPNATLKISQL